MSAVASYPSGTETVAGAKLLGANAAGVVKQFYPACVNVLDFGADRTGAADSTASMQSAHNTGLPVYYPAGVYKFTKITIGTGGIIGDGPGITTGVNGCTTLRSTSTNTDDLITYNSTSGISGGAPVFRDFGLIVDEGTKSGGAGICINPSNAKVERAAFYNLLMRYVPGGLKFRNAADYVIEKCGFFYYTGKAIDIANDQNPDAGDSCITNCHFFNGNGAYASVGTAIYQTNSGGLKVIGNKFNGGLNHYQLDLKNTSSILIFNGNSCENCSGSAVNFKNTANTSGAPIRWTAVNVSGNHFANNGRDIYVESISNSPGVSFWDDFVLGPNIHYLGNGANPRIELNTLRGFSIIGSVMDGAPVGVLVNSTTSSGKILLTTQSVTTPVTNNGTGVTVL